MLNPRLIRSLLLIFQRKPQVNSHHVAFSQVNSHHVAFSLPRLIRSLLLILVGIFPCHVIMLNPRLIRSLLLIFQRKPQVNSRCIFRNAEILLENGVEVVRGGKYQQQLYYDRNLMEMEPSARTQNMVPKWLEKILGNLLVFRAVVTEWLKYYVIFPKAVSFIFGQILVHAWVEYALVAILMTRLTDDLLHLPKAASIVNVQDGTSAFLVLVVAYASDAHIGPFLAVICTTVAYISGLLLLYIAASRLQSVEIQLLYVAVILVALGRAGRAIPLKEFLADQLRAEGSSEDEEQVESRRKVWWRSAYILGIFASVYVFANASWIQLCMISAIAMGAAFAFFLCGTAFYEYKKRKKSSLNNVLRVFYAAIAKTHLSHTSFDNDNHILDVSMLRWLDKAAIVESSPSLEEQLSKGRLCTVEQVEEVKILLTMVPLWTTFLVYGLLQATGNTFFFEQTNYTDNHLGHISNVPVVIFVIIKSSTRFIVSWLCDLLLPSYWGEKTPRLVMLVRIGVGMAISPICCIVAWRVEVHRLHNVNLNISTSFFWLIPQFLLLGLMEGLVFDGMEEIYSSVVPDSLNKYGPSFTEFALNIGHFISLIFISIYHNLFSDDLNMSRLGVYYRKLAYVCFANLLIYCYVATYYVMKQESSGAQDIEEQLRSLEDGPECSQQQQVE